MFQTFLGISVGEAGGFYSLEGLEGFVVLEGTINDFLGISFSKVDEFFEIESFDVDLFEREVSVGIHSDVSKEELVWGFFWFRRGWGRLCWDCFVGFFGRVHLNGMERIGFGGIKVFE